MASRAKQVLRVVGTSVVLVLLIFAAIAWIMLSRVTGKPHPLPQQPHPGAPERLELTEQSVEMGGRIRVHILYTGKTTVPFGQFFGGLEGWVGATALWKAGLQDELFWVPAPVVVVAHPIVGVVLLDTGISAGQCDPFAYYSVLDGGLNAGIWRDSYNEQAAEGGLLAQLRGLEIEPHDVRHVVLSHLHEDHVGELARFPDAVVHVSRAEWEDRSRVAYEPTFASVTHWDHFEYDSGRFASFNASKDLFGDGTIVLLPTPGHSMGHAATLVHLGDHHALFTGDAAYTLRHLDPEALASFNYFGQQGLTTYQDSIRRIVALQGVLSDLVIIPPHDPFEYNRVHVRAALADGQFSPKERKHLQGLQAALFTDDGLLRAAARPVWTPKGIRTEMP